MQRTHIRRRDACDWAGSRRKGGEICKEFGGFCVQRGLIYDFYDNLV